MYKYTSGLTMPKVGGKAAREKSDRAINAAQNTTTDAALASSKGERVRGRHETQAVNRVAYPLRPDLTFTPVYEKNRPRNTEVVRYLGSDPVLLPLLLSPPLAPPAPRHPRAAGRGARRGASPHAVVQLLGAALGIDLLKVCLAPALAQATGTASSARGAVPTSRRRRLRSPPTGC